MVGLWQNVWPKRLNNMKKFVKQIKVTQEKAREMERKGWILEYVEMNTDGTDTYNVFEKEGTV